LPSRDRRRRRTVRPARSAGGARDRGPGLLPRLAQYGTTGRGPAVVGRVCGPGVPGAAAPLL